jgi:hypothetical protein
MYHPNLPSLRSLLSGISLPKTDEEGGEIIVAMAAPPPAADPSPVWTPRLASLSKMQGDGKIIVIMSSLSVVITDHITKVISKVRTICKI